MDEANSPCPKLPARQIKPTKVTEVSLVMLVEVKWVLDTNLCKGQRQRLLRPNKEPNDRLQAAVNSVASFHSRGIEEMQ